jgi:hypothetical protein
MRDLIGTNYLTILGSIKNREIMQGKCWKYKKRKNWKLKK